MTQQVPNSLLAFDGGALGHRNRIINGSMSIDQRNSGVSVSSGLNVITYTLDRWSVAASGAAVTVQRLGSPGSYYLNITGAASNTSVNIRHRIEAANIADLAGQTVTVSFVCSSTTATTLAVTAGYASAADNFTTVTQIATTNKTINAVGNTYSVQFTLPANAANGVELIFGLTNFTSGTFSITNAQLEPGQVNTPFERLPVGLDLAMCQRYFEVVSGVSISTRPAYTPYGFKVSKRATPTLALFAGALGGANYVVTNADGFTCPEITVASSTSGWSISASAEL
jgi:hypothetical protein